MIIKKYKHNKKIVCYITYSDSCRLFKLCTGKPSDYSCLSWFYVQKENAETAAEQYLQNYKTIMNIKY